MELYQFPFFMSVIDICIGVLCTTTGIHTVQWLFSMKRLVIDNYTIVATYNASSKLRCSVYCSFPTSSALSMYYLSDTSTCYCNAIFDNRTELNTTAHITYAEVTCDNPTDLVLGLCNEQISVLGSYEEFPGYKARFGEAGTWTSNRYSWIKFDFGAKKIVKSISTKGSNMGWVSEYFVSYYTDVDCGNNTYVTDENGETLVNQSSPDVKPRFFTEPCFGVLTYFFAVLFDMSIS